MVKVENLSKDDDVSTVERRSSLLAVLRNFEFMGKSWPKLVVVVVVAAVVVVVESFIDKITNSHAIYQ